MNDKLYNVGMYIRLSTESTAYRGEESMSIENQQAILSKFIAMMPSWVEKRMYIDNGATGGNFNRKGFQDMMEDVRSGVINLVLVKDLSRFGRNYLESGKYLEEILPSLGCRFVALDDGVDSEDGENDIVPFLSAMNDFYLKNISDRIKSVLTAKAKNGEKLSGYVPYGYDRSPEHHTRLIVDEYAAGIVRKIFELRTTGIGYAKIAGVMNQDGIIPPRLYYYTRQNREPARCTNVWHDMTVKAILKNELYLGNTVSFKERTRSYRDNRSVPRNEDEWIRVENTHEPIICEEVWTKVQTLNRAAKKRSESFRKPQKSLFCGFLLCSDCGATLVSNTEKQIRKTGKIVPYTSYHCSTYSATGGSTCSRHTIYELSLKKLLLDDIRAQAELIQLDGNRMLQSLQSRVADDYVSQKVEIAKERKRIEQRLHTLELQLEKLYEDKVSGTISSVRFSELAQKHEAERQNTETRLAAISKTITEANAKLRDIETWMHLIKEKSTLEDVDRDFLETLVEKIEIGERKVENGAKAQDIRIFYKFIGSALCPSI